MQPMKPVLLRPPNPDDLDFIMSTWLRSYQQSGDNPIRGSRYWWYQHDLITNILKRSMVIMAVNPDALDQIYGYVIFQPLGEDVILHWIYIKFTYRHLRMAQ